MKILFLFIILVIVNQNPLFSEQKKKDLIVFQAPFFNPVMNSLKSSISEELGFNLKVEISGSQILMRKVVDLKRNCDLIVIADSTLFKSMGGKLIEWRIDFAGDELVIGVGKTAKYADLAQKNWVEALQKPGIRLARADEELSPIGLRTLLFFKLAELKIKPGLYGALLKQCVKKPADVELLSVNLKTGDVDYGFLYKSTAVDHGIRFIEVGKPFNISDQTFPYSNITVIFNKNGISNPVSWKGSAITYSLSIPVNSENQRSAIDLIQFILKTNHKILDESGFIVINPLFYGLKKDYVKFSNICVYGGEY